MKRWLVAIVTFALVSAACTAGGSDDDRRRSTPAPARRTSRSRSRCGAPGRRRRSSRTSTRSSRRSKRPYPWITVKSVGNVDDTKMVAAINSGTPPDAALSFSLDNVGKFCQSGAWQDLTPYIDQTGFDTTQFPPVVEEYTSFGGSRCALPFLTDAYGLYYNKDMFDKAGHHRAAEDDVRAGGRREEAHRLQRRRLDQGRRASCRTWRTTRPTWSRSPRCSTPSGTATTAPRRP